MYKNTTNVIIREYYKASVCHNTCQREIGNFGLRDINERVKKFIEFWKYIIADIGGIHNGVT